MPPYTYSPPLANEVINSFIEYRPPDTVYQGQTLFVVPDGPFVYNNTSALGDSFGWSIPTHSGTYQVFYENYTNANGGQLQHQVSMDGGNTWTNLGAAIDQYSAAAGTNNGVLVGTVTCKGPILHRVTLVGKNAASAAYQAIIAGLIYKRTGN